MTTIDTPPRGFGSRLVPLLPIAVLGTAYGAVAGSAVDAVVPMAVFALVWAGLVIATAPQVARRGAQSLVWANAPVFLACPLALMVLGAAVLGQVLSTTPEFSLVLFQQPSYGLSFVTVHVLFEWLLLPAALMLNWYDRPRRKLLLVVAGVFYVGRICSALYFAPNAMDWGQLPANTLPSASLLDDIQLWVNLNLIRLVLQDGLTAVLLLVVALRPSQAATGTLQPARN